MKIKLTTILILFALVAVLFAADGALVFDFSVDNVGDDVKISWRTTDEINVSSFVIQRSPVKYDNYSDITSFSPKGNNSSYSYTDDTAYKTSDVIFKYKLQINTASGAEPTYSQVKTVVQNISGVKRTWGSIKAMFR
jgi:hypothetical protein